MKKKVLLFVLSLFALAVMLKPYYTVYAALDYGVGVQYRLDTGHKFETLFNWRFE